MRAAVRAMVIGLLLFPLALVLHEVLHLALITALGGDGELIERPWRFQFLPIDLPSLHVSGASRLGWVRHVAFDLGGPGLAAAGLAVAAALVRDRAARAALVANSVILVFFAVIESADFVLDGVPSVSLPFLAWEEFNYGVPLLVLAAACLLLTRSRANATA